MSDGSQGDKPGGAVAAPSSPPGAVESAERRSSRPPPPPRRSSMPSSPDGLTAVRVPTEPPRPASRAPSVPSYDPDRPASKRTPIPPKPEELAKLSEPAARLTPTTPIPAAPIVPVAPGSIPASIPSPSIPRVSAAPTPQFFETPNIPEAPPLGSFGSAPASTPKSPEGGRAPSPSAPEIRTHMSSYPPGGENFEAAADSSEVPVPSSQGDEVHVEEAPPAHFPTDEDIAEPIRAMRVMKLSEATKKGTSIPAPEVETSEATYDDVEAGLDGEQLRALNPTSPPPPEVDIPVDEDVEAPPDSVEVFEDPVEDVAPQRAAPPPPHRASAAPELPPAPPPPPRRSAKPALPTAKTPRKKPWWETLFGDDFSRAYRPMSQSQLSREVDFILDQTQLPRGAVVLDLGCGQGEICVELSRRGYSAVGYDLSVFQLAMAGDNAQQARQKINFLQGDMREMAFDQMFDAVLCWDTTFGYFEDDKNLDVLRRVKNALKPNGRLLLDVMNRDFAARESPMNHWFEGDGCVCMDDMNLDYITNRLVVKRSIILDDGRSKEQQFSTRLYTLSELGRMLHDVGFRVSAVSGDIATKGAFFGPHSRRIIIQAEKP